MQNEYIIHLAQVLGLFGLAQCWPWVCSIWPRYLVFSVWPSVGLGSVRSGPCTESFRYGPVLVLGLFDLAQVLSLFCLARAWSWVGFVWSSVGLGSDRSDPGWPRSVLPGPYLNSVLFCLNPPPCPRPKSVWPIPVLGRGLHPGIYVCWPIIRRIYPFHLQDWLGRLPVVWFWIEKWQNRYLVQTGRCLNF